MNATQPAGTYTGKVKYTLVHPASEEPLQPQTTQSGKICYYPNGANVDGTMGCQDVASSVTLLASNFSRTGYGFAGWSRNPNADPNGANATTEIYGPNAEYTVPARTNFDSNKNLTLYAIWVPLAKDSNNNDLTFQTANLLSTTLSDNSTLDSKSNGYVTALKDTRDNEVYAVAKLADGNYWMIENMRLDLSSSSTTITTSNTNHPTQAFVTDINTNYKGKADDPNTTLWKTCTDVTPACIDQISFAINELNRESVTPITTAPTYEFQAYGWRSYGAHYNWYTATAGNGTYSMASGNVTGDLCPSGWHLPTADNGGDLKTYNSVANNNDNNNDPGYRTYPANFVYSGDIGVVIAGRGSNGRYWSATAKDNKNAYRLGLPNKRLSEYRKWDGFAIRCIAN
jgi:uncharacterized protein (TIGR02145 family)